MKKLKDMGVVKGSHLEIDPSELGYDICAFVGVFLEKGSFFKEIVKELVAIREITEIHYTTGRYSIFLKIVCRNTKELRHILNDKLQPITNIQRTETFISLEESIVRPIKVLDD
jgi:Lrp/AsnC family transcriptional regulator for asnA, asnC and gidA